MKTSLQLNVSQQQTISPQLQQALHFLQLNTQELQQSIHQLIEQNPFLTISEDLAETTETEVNQISDNRSEEITEYFDNPSINEEFPIDANWEDYYQDDNHSSQSSISSNSSLLDDQYPNSDFGDKQNRSIHSHLREQAQLTPFTELEQILAEWIIDSLDENGFLSTSLEELISSFDLLNLSEYEKNSFHSVLKRIQLFEPVGLATENLSECLLIQLTQFENNPTKELAQKLLTEHKFLLEKRDFRNIIKVEKCTENELQLALELLKTLEPFPAKSFLKNEDDIVIPDILMKKTAKGWSITLNRSQLPDLVLDEQYVEMLKRFKNKGRPSNTQTKSDKSFLNDMFADAKSKIEALSIRNNTLLTVATWIIHYQLDFFEKGTEFLKPLTLSKVATNVGFSESTISRVCQNKLIYGVYGFLPLKQLFSNSIESEENIDISAHSIKMKIKYWIDEEDKRKPLSDSKLMNKLADENINVARRTVTKYREQLGFEPSHLRKIL